MGSTVTNLTKLEASQADTRNTTLVIGYQTPPLFKAQVEGQGLTLHAINFEKTAEGDGVATISHFEQHGVRFTGGHLSKSCYVVDPLMTIALPEKTTAVCLSLRVQNAGVSAEVKYTVTVVAGTEKVYSNCSARFVTFTVSKSEVIRQLRIATLQQSLCIDGCDVYLRTQSLQSV